MKGSGCVSIRRSVGEGGAGRRYVSLSVGIVVFAGEVKQKQKESMAGPGVVFLFVLFLRASERRAPFAEHLPLLYKCTKRCTKRPLQTSAYASGYL